MKKGIILGLLNLFIPNVQSSSNNIQLDNLHSYQSDRQNHRQLDMFDYKKRLYIKNWILEQQHAEQNRSSNILGDSSIKLDEIRDDDLSPHEKPDGYFNRDIAPKDWRTQE